MILGRLALGWGLTLFVVMAAVAGVEIWQGEECLEDGIASRFDSGAKSSQAKTAAGFGVRPQEEATLYSVCETDLSEAIATSTNGLSVLYPQVYRSITSVGQQTVCDQIISKLSHRGRISSEVITPLPNEQIKPIASGDTRSICSTLTSFKAAAFAALAGTNGIASIESGLPDATSTMAPPTDAPVSDTPIEEDEGSEPTSVLQVSEVRQALPDAQTSSRLPAHPACGSTWACFFWGYYDAGGRYPTERIDAMIQCESSWRVDPGGSHFGLAQFSADTWIKARRSPDADYRDPYDQGYATARWLGMIQNPGSSAGWPTCWWAWE